PWFIPTAITGNILKKWMFETRNSKPKCMKLKFVIFVLTLLVCNTLFAQNKFAGTWNGQLKIGDTLRLVLHISESVGGSYIGTLDSPDQNAFGIKCDKVEVIETGINPTLNFS